MASTSSPSALRDKNHRRFLLRKLHSLSGIFPLGVFLVVHLFTNARAIVSQASYESAVKDFQALPYLVVIEVVGVLLPLAFHGIYGVVLSFEGRQNVAKYQGNRNWMYLAQRVTGFVAFAFILWHLSHLWVPKLLGKLAPVDFYGELVRRLSTPSHGLPLTALGYVFGVAACVFHFANGLWGFLTSWGITPTRRSQRLATSLVWIAGLAVLVLGAASAIFFATGSRLDFFTPGERSEIDAGRPRTAAPPANPFPGVGPGAPGGALPPAIVPSAPLPGGAP